MGREIVVCAGCSPPRRGTSPRATFSPPHLWTPAAAGTLRYENGAGCWKGLGAIGATRPPPLDYSFRWNHHGLAKAALENENGGTPGTCLGTSLGATGLTLTPTLSHRGRGGNRSASVGTVYRGSESGTCLHSNRSCRLPPAHQVMKIVGSFVGWQSRASAPLDSSFRWSICVECQGYSGGWDWECSYAPPAPHPGGGRAPALHFPLPTSGLRLPPAHKGMKLGLVVANV